MQPRIIHLDRVDSTNGYLAEEIRKGSIQEEMVVISDYQENGRGQGDHSWHSNPGENLLMSMLLFPAFLSASGSFHLSRVVSLALCDLLTGWDLDPAIKWPNDILIGSRKIAGILIENGITGTRITHTIMGVGMNINQQDFPPFPLPATSLAIESGMLLNTGETAEQLLGSVMARYDMLKGGDTGQLEADYLERMYLLNTVSRFMSGEGLFSGTILGVNDYGELLVEREGRTRSFGFQEIQYQLPGPQN